MSIRAQMALEAGKIAPRDVPWVRSRLRQGRFSPWCMDVLEALASGKRVDVEDRCRARASRLGYRGNWEYDQVQKWLEEQGLHGYFVN